MKQSFWHACWEKNSLGFHQETVHPFISQHIIPHITANNRHHKLSQITPSEHGLQSVFVPLCGKSNDLVALSAYFNVVGVELSPIACNDFFKEKSLSVVPVRKSRFYDYCHENISILQGDIFELTLADVAPCHYIYDRAALVAFPVHMQVQYAAHLATFISNGAHLYLVSVEYSEDQIEGPPFSLNQQSIERLFPNFSVECIAEKKLHDKRFGQRIFDVDELTEKLYFIQS